MSHFLWQNPRNELPRLPRWGEGNRGLLGFSEAPRPTLSQSERMNPIERVVVPTKDGYDRRSDVYDGDGNPLVLLEEPHVARLLGDVRGLSVLDVGCGTGRHAVRLAQQGGRVTGVDFSAGMLGKARQKPGAERVTFVEHNITEPLPFARRHSTECFPASFWITCPTCQCFLPSCAACVGARDSWWHP